MSQKKDSENIPIIDEAFAKNLLQCFWQRKINQHQVPTYFTQDETFTSNSSEPYVSRVQLSKDLRDPLNNTLLEISGLEGIGRGSNKKIAEKRAAVDLLQKLYPFGVLKGIVGSSLVKDTALSEISSQPIVPKTKSKSPQPILVSKPSSLTKSLLLLPTSSKHKLKVPKKPALHHPQLSQHSYSYQVLPNSQLWTASSVTEIDSSTIPYQKNFPIQTSTSQNLLPTKPYLSAPNYHQLTGTTVHHLPVIQIPLATNPQIPLNQNPQVITPSQRIPAVHVVLKSPQLSQPQRKRGLEEDPPIPSKKKRAEKPLIVLDAQNVAKSGNGEFKSKLIHLTIKYWEDRGFPVIGFLPQYRMSPHSSEKANDIPLLQTLIDAGYLVLTPSQDYDDSYIIQYAKQHNGYIVSCDMFRDYIRKARDSTEYKERFTWIQGHVISFVFVKNQFLPNPDFQFPSGID